MLLSLIHILYGKIHDLAKNDKKIIKETFGSLALGNYLKNKQYNEITLVGVVSNICVISVSYTHLDVYKRQLPHMHNHIFSCWDSVTW